MDMGRHIEEGAWDAHYLDRCGDPLAGNEKGFNNPRAKKDIAY